ncbi:hypothetical protein L3X38_011758 [Prunus dulcis]|uniref:Uncharacterized protein n=1 Tax=Prunus dulcis TaxID=3755 RepID=A0AAD4ZEL4_PRUDU|nr:hypothetical protein L3X38_011758 [Prunus dulcis]
MRISIALLEEEVQNNRQRTKWNTQMRDLEVMWRLAQNILPTRDVLFKRKITQDAFGVLLEWKLLYMLFRCRPNPKPRSSGSSIPSQGQVEVQPEAKWKPNSKPSQVETQLHKA